MLHHQFSLIRRSCYCFYYCFTSIVKITAIKAFYIKKTMQLGIIVILTFHLRSIGFCFSYDTLLSYILGFSKISEYLALKCRMYSGGSLRYAYEGFWGKNPFGEKIQNLKFNIEICVEQENLRWRRNAIHVVDWCGLPRNFKRIISHVS